jgi:hypothetical protein
MEKGRHILDGWMKGGISDSAQTFYHNTLVRFSLLVAFVLQCVSFVLLSFFVRTQQSIVVVHYNVYFGVDLIGERAQIFIVPSVVLLFVAVNTVLAQRLYKQQERIAAYVLLLASILISLGSLFACASIALINY